MGIVEKFLYPRALQFGAGQRLRDTRWFDDYGSGKQYTSDGF